MRSRPPRRTLAAGLAVSLLGLAAAVEAAPYRKGEPVVISGKIMDGDGAPISEVTVLLELSRKSFQLRRLRRVKSSTLSVPVTSGADGRYRHTWHWDGYYNTFELAIAMPVLKTGDGYEIIHRTEITAAVDRGGVVEVPIVIQDTSYLEWLRRFLDGRASPEEKRIFGEMGRPDRIDNHGGDAFAWWYFEAGKVYRFRDGALELIEPFEPIEPL